MTRRQGLILVAQTAVLIASASAAAWHSQSADWQPVELVLLLLALSVGSEALTLEVRGVRMSGSFLAIVLAMALLGPAPAVAIALASVIVDATLDWRGWLPASINLGTYSLFALAGSAVMTVVTSGPATAHEDPLGFGAAVLIVFMLTNVLNFMIIAVCSEARSRDAHPRERPVDLPHDAAGGVRDGAPHRRGRLQLRPDRRRRGRPAGRGAVHLPVPDPHRSSMCTSVARSSVSAPVSWRPSRSGC